MIQIIGLRKYFCKKDQKEKTKHKLFATYKSLNYIFENIDEVISAIPKEERWNVYYTALNCKDPGEHQRKLRIFDSQRYIPFDVDNLAPDKLDDYINLFFEQTKLDRDKTAIVFSGNGLQFIVEIPEPFTEVTFFEAHRIYYKAICADYDSRLKKEGLPGDMDPSVWSPARILRLPNTENRKPKKGTKHARLLKGGLAPQELDWSKIAKIEKVEDDHQIKAWDPKNEPQIDHREIYSKCNFFKWTKDNPNLVREPHFYSAISIIARMQDGTGRVHALAKNISESGNDSSVAGYSHEEIERKIDQALTNSGPRTCKGIDAIWGHCKKCPMYRKIESPISLKGEEFISTKDTGFHNWVNKKPIPNYTDLLKFFDQKYHHKTLDSNGLVYVFKDNHYQPFSSTQIANFAYSHFKPTPKKAVVAEFEKLVKSTNLVSVDFFTQGINGLLNLNNGVLDLKTGELKSHSPDYGFRYIVPYDFDPHAEAPVFKEFLHNIMNGDEERISLLEEFGGYALSGDEYKFHKFLMLSGTGRNGKGTFVHILKKLAGRENVADVPLGKMGNENNKQLLEGKLFNFCDEVNLGDFKDIGEIKKMTGEGEILVKMMWHQPYLIQARAKLIFSCNELPYLPETNVAVRDRILLVPFENQYTDEKGNIDRGLKAKLEAELPGILNIFLNGYNRLETRGHFTQSTMMAKALTEYISSQNPVAEWLEDTPELEVLPLNGRHTFVPSDVLWKQFNEWFIHQGGKEMAHNAFSKKLCQVIDDGRNRKVKRQFSGVRKWGFDDLRYGTHTLENVSNTGHSDGNPETQQNSSCANKINSRPSIQI